jgi:hypothetical protein
MDYELGLLLDIGDSIDKLHIDYPHFCDDDQRYIEEDRENAKLILEPLYEMLCALYEGLPDVE